MIARSVIFASFDGADYVLCGLADGHLFTFVYDKEVRHAPRPLIFSLCADRLLRRTTLSQTRTLSDRKKLSLGTQPLTLTQFNSRNGSHVFACSDRPTVVYSANKKLLYSNVNLKEVSSALR